jgi:hypothetical protein
VWHQSFLKLLDSIIALSKTGFSHKCYDGKLRWLFPLILILSANYEEQYVSLNIISPFLMFLQVCDGADKGPEL